MTAMRVADGSGGGRGALGRHLQHQFVTRCPSGWRCEAERPLLEPAAGKRLGVASKVDLLMERTDGSRRIWIELEISRADPVANQAKFAAAAYFEECLRGDAFVSMASRHIVRGRRALLAGMAVLMRSIGIPAFQIDLLPHLDGAQIKTLNAMSADRLRASPHIDIGLEIERVLAITELRVAAGWHRIHMADNPFAVATNIRTWNREIADPVVAKQWGRRRIQYFVHDDVGDEFAPSKFCAFVPASTGGSSAGPFMGIREAAGGMTSELYLSLGEGDPRFDGNVAQEHLKRRLRYRAVRLTDAPVGTASAFERWLAERADAVQVRGEAVLLLAPDQG